jgi:presenilin-like A22 family membrane protease
MLFHNLTELLIYPGIAAVFVPVLSLWSVFILLILISAYDLYAVWHSGIMQKMAKFQISQLKIFAGFLIPSITDKVKTQIEKYKSLSAKDKKKYASKFKKIKIGMAMLGGGDVVFPIIVSGVVYLSMGLLPALMIILFSTIALILLLLFSEKGKFYPAMPFISAGCFLGLFFAWLISFI